MVKFLDDMEREKPIRFTSQQLQIATENFTTILGSGGFGTVYKGIVSNVCYRVWDGLQSIFMAVLAVAVIVCGAIIICSYFFCLDRTQAELVMLCVTLIADIQWLRKDYHSYSQSIPRTIVSNGTIVAVKVLNRTSDKQIEEQFKAEMSTMGRTHHFNLVRLYGFCFESSLIALVYEFMVNGSLDNHLFKANEESIIGFEKLHEIAIGTARGIAYLHEECPQRIIHYDIKPGNILLDSNFCPKVADFGLAKLCNRDKSHVMMTGGRGTPGYAAPELWMPLPVTHKCDVYSFGKLLFELIGRRRNMDINLCDSQQWFPKWAWDKFENTQLHELISVCGIEEKDKEVAEMMVKVALCCVQYRPETRPEMSMVVKMLEGALDVPEFLNPFSHLYSGDCNLGGDGRGFDSSLTEVVTGSTVTCGTPVMRKYNITIATE